MHLVGLVELAALVFPPGLYLPGTKGIYKQEEAAPS